ncbi:MAG TPA: type II secretion system F family protein [Methylibium sp.]|uniref:type II secretion system F family protein n=1 Tax=Methylibium sp. TaxID=2067992 RepID=UPI002DBC78FC|nr:type II secretion system F family protein [Methylibium sp.]HEU4460133.1 type II secretion system F family protein [Methylibium sp.]
MDAPLDAARPAAAWMPRRAGGAPFALPLFAQELLALLEAGLALNEALSALHEREAPGPRRAVIGALLASLREGLRFSDAAQRQPQAFPALVVGLLRAAEHTSDLPRALARYIEWRERVDQLRARIVSAAIYPAILATVGAAVTLFLMLKVVPSFAEVYRDGGRSMPWASALLLDAGQWLAAHATAVLAALCALTVWGLPRARAFLRREGAAALLARVPGLAPHVLAIERSRLYLTLGMLLEGGIAVLPALELIERSSAPALARRLAQVRRRLGEGQPLSHALQREQLATPVALRLLHVGERSGSLGPMLTHAARFHDGENARFVERFAKAFEPALMALVGLVIAAIVLLLYLPIFDLAGSLE